MYLKLLLRLVLIVCCVGDVLFATTFKPLPLEEQIGNSSAIIYAKFLGKSYKKTHNDQVVTEFSFSIVKSAGLNSSDVSNKNNFKIIAPGGIWQGIVYQVHGTPSFKLGEEVVLLLTESNNNYYFSNLALSKYDVFREKGEIYLKSSVFPYHPKLGVISYNELNQKVYSKFGHFISDIRDYESRNVAKLKNIKKDRRGRYIANEMDQDGHQTKDGNDGKIHILWLILLMGILGSYPMYSFKRKNK